jgi:hypothetical protein
MRESYLRPNYNYPRFPSKVTSIHSLKLGLELSLISTQNKNTKDITFPSYRQTGQAESKSRRSIIRMPMIKPSSLSQSHKKYFSPDRAKSNFPMTGPETIRSMNDFLSEFELIELQACTEVYFIGASKNKIHGNLKELNWGYDDDHANYNIIIGDHIAYRYEILTILGKGAFGQVCKCLDKKTSEIVAIKINSINKAKSRLRF